MNASQILHILERGIDPEILATSVREAPSEEKECDLEIRRHSPYQPSVEYSLVYHRFSRHKR